MGNPRCVPFHLAIFRPRLVRVPLLGPPPPARVGREWPGSFPGRFWRSCGTHSRVRPPSEKNDVGEICQSHGEQTPQGMVEAHGGCMGGGACRQSMRVQARAHMQPMIWSGLNAYSQGLSKAVPSVSFGEDLSKWPTSLCPDRVRREPRSPRGHAWPLGAMQPLHVPGGGSICILQPHACRK